MYSLHLQCQNNLLLLELSLRMNYIIPCPASRIIILVYLRCSRVGTWPVAMLEQSKDKTILEGPVCNGSQVIGWHTNVKSKRLRRFHVDMSGFAFNSTILWDPKRRRGHTSVPIRQLETVKEGFQVFMIELRLPFILSSLQYRFQVPTY